MLIEVRDKYNDERVWLSLKRASLSVTFSQAEVYTFDLEGRLILGWLRDQTYIRTLGNRIVKKWRSSDRAAPWKMIEELGAGQTQEFFERTWQRIQALVRKLQGGDAEFVNRRSESGASIERARKFLAKISAWDWPRLEREREIFFSIYAPVTILPPDQYLGLVLQATEGCHWNRCTFCHFYRHSKFRIKSEREFAQHARSVKEFFGEGIWMRRSIFLGDANAVVIPQERLLKIFDLVNEEFPSEGGGSKRSSKQRHVFEGIYSFIDSFTGDKKSEADFRELRERNLHGVYVGAETGCNELLKFLNKPATSERTLETIRTLKKAGLRVGVIILVGAGGDYYFRSHVEETIELLNELPLGKEDIIYFSPLVESAQSEYARLAEEAGIRFLTDDEKREQLRAIRSALRFREDKKPKLARYDIREFVY